MFSHKKPDTFHGASPSGTTAVGAPLLGLGAVVAHGRHVALVGRVARVLRIALRRR